MILGSSIEPEKASAKSASTPYPPQKVNFIGVLIIRDPISSSWLNNYDSYFCLVLFCLFLLSAYVCFWNCGYIVFLFGCCYFLFGVFWSGLVLGLEVATLNTTCRRPPKRGNTGAVAGNLSTRWTTMGEIIRDPIDQAQT
jgi:hypothetical protein